MATKYQRTSTDVDGYTRIKHEFIPMRDGVKLCADLFLPFSSSKYGEKVPVLCSMGPYGKDIHASTFGLPKTPIYAEMYKKIKPLGPDACFEQAEPLIWCKEYGYALLRVDTRGIGGSEGKLDPFGLERSNQIKADAEGQDLYDVVEWAAAQSWSSGKVAFTGISYLGMVGYWAAMQKPPHLTCVISYESACSIYQATRRGGIYSDNFQSHWYHNIVLPQQSGAQDGSRTAKELEANRVDFPRMLTTDEYPDQGCFEFLEKARVLSDIDVPFYIAGNWTDPELHLPGNIRAFNGISSEYKWLEMHTGNHLGAYYEPEHIALQRKFLDYFLFDKQDNGMLEVPRIRLLQHHGTKTLYRQDEAAFPTPDAQDTSFYLTTQKKLSLSYPEGEKQPFSYRGYRENLSFTLESSFDESFEILGSPYLELEVITKAEDLDLFIYLRAIDENGNTFILEGNHGEPMDNFARGYFRLSHRDEVAKDFDTRKVITQPPTPKSEVVPGQVYRVVVPIYPAAFLFDKGQTLSLEIGSVDTPSTIPPMRHEGGDRVAERFEGENVIFSHGRLVLPRVRR
ncbi:Alpha/Beta hydrolase protein [Fusarium redolens]|uniref:Alpha/Beta hydrolase protein n=1 Tax=Fusarium redolens TaxID=48865 RepID=A0A9P9GXZ5_FUSRE|nr:Alpha/Beta hydrolase protein [Fusarium redolens]KAH7247578.1 Alpha/Beta hydrolase protein [Fusarium redolens]